MILSVQKCKLDHIPKWLVVYDIGKDKTEEILVCESCFTDPDNDCFRSYILAKEEITGETSN